MHGESFWSLFHFRNHNNQHTYHIRNESLLRENIHIHVYIHVGITLSRFKNEKKERTKMMICDREIPNKKERFHNRRDHIFREKRRDKRGRNMWKTTPVRVLFSAKHRAEPANVTIIFLKHECLRTKIVLT